jgi:uncharacterized iron-regulated membrane protein
MVGPPRGGIDTISESQGRAFSWSRLAFLVHSWLGLKLTLVLSIVLLSGALAVFRFEIDWLIYPQMRVTPSDGRASLDQILSAVEAAYPDMALVGDLPTSASASAGRMALGVIAVSRERGVRTIWVDPYRGTVRGDTPLMTPGFFLAQLHRDLFIPEWGLAIVCSCAILIALSLVTGLVTYKRFWRGFLRRPRLRDLRTALGDLHRLTALWSLWFVAVIAATRLWYFWTLVGEPKLGLPQAVQQNATPGLSEAALDALGPATPRMISLDAALKGVTERYPDFSAAYVSLPAYHGAALVFHGSRGEVLARYATMISVDPFSGGILGADLASDAPPLNRVDALVDPIHFGDFAGVFSKAVWFLFGLGLSGLAISGLAIFWLRTARAAVGPGRRLLRAWHPWRGAMAWLKPVNWAIVAVAIVAAIMTVDFYFRGPANLPARYSPQEIGPWRLGATLVAGLGDTRDPVRAGARVLAIIDYCPGCWDDIRRLSVDVGLSPPRAEKPGAPVFGPPGFAYAQLILPADLGPQQRLWLVAEGWDRRRHVASWQIGTLHTSTDAAP